MKINTLLTESVDLCRRHPLILVPMLAPAIVYLLVSLVAVDPMASVSGSLGSLGSAFGLMLFTTMVNVLVTLIAQGMTVLMAQEALESGATSLVSGWQRVLVRIVPLAITTVIVALILGFGFALFLLPGLVAALFLAFVVPEVLVGEKSPLQAITGSVRLVTANFSSVVIIFLVLLALAVVLGIVNLILGLIPFVGWLLSMVLGAAFTGFTGVLVLQVYREIASGAAPPDVEAT